MVAEAGVSNVVIDPAAFLDLEHPPFRYSIAIVNPQTKVVLRSWGKRLISDATMIAGDAAFENATDLISVRCSDAYAICAVAALDRSQALSRQSPFIYGFIGFGAVAGGLLALATMWRGEATSFARLKRAMQADELTVVYQPIIDLNSARMISAEALVRWTDRTGKVIAPDVFVAAAEEAGTAGEITAYVLKKVSAKAGAFLRQNPDFRITVNIVTADLDDARFYEALKGAVGTAGISPRQIGLELTERSAASLDVAGPAIARLRKLGHLVYLDDFGTGYSSLANLQELNVDIIKIDRAFTKTVGTASVKVSIVPQILDMAIALKLGVVIEGIETQEQFDYFANATPSCAGQGWLISRPLTLRQLVAFHQQNASK
jgi:sensor c-di-GMP phosphodiesterase-like protein